MKRKFAALMTVFVLVLVMSVPTVFAAEENSLKSVDYFESMFDFMRNWIKDAQEKDQISKEETKEWEKHFNYIEKLHEKNGFSRHCF